MTSVAAVTIRTTRRCHGGLSGHVTVDPIRPAQIDAVYGPMLWFIHGLRRQSSVVKSMSFRSACSRLTHWLNDGL